MTEDDKQLVERLEDYSQSIHHEAAAAIRRLSGEVHELDDEVRDARSQQASAEQDLCKALDENRQARELLERAGQRINDAIAFEHPQHGLLPSKEIERRCDQWDADLDAFLTIQPEKVDS